MRDKVLVPTFIIMYMDKMSNHKRPGSLAYWQGKGQTLLP